MSMKSTWIEGFTLSEHSIEFGGAYALTDEDKAALIGKNGYTLFLNKDYLEQLLREEPDENLIILLLQHNLARLTENESFMKPDDSTMEIRPSFFMIDLTNRCNMACKYCLRDGNNTVKPKVMTEETLNRVCDHIIQYCLKTGEHQISVQPWGGEPTLEMDKIFMIQNRLKAADIDPCITIETNGLLLNEETIRQMKDCNFWVSVSIDGPEAIHNRQRVFSNGQPTHSIVEENLKRLLMAYEGRVSVIATVTRESFHHIPEIIHYLNEELKICNIKINYVHKSNFVDNSLLCMKENEIAAAALSVFETMIDLVRKGNNISEYNIFTRLMNLLYRRKSDVCLCDGCHGGRKMIVYDYQGGIYPCDLTDYPEECMGTIDSGTDLVEIVEAAVKNHAYFIEKEEDKCKDCPWRCYCKGGCTVHVKTDGSMPPTTDKIECSVNRVLYPRLLDTIFHDAQTVNKLLQMEAL